MRKQQVSVMTEGFTDSHPDSLDEKGARVMAKRFADSNIEVTARVL